MYKLICIDHMLDVWYWHCFLCWQDVTQQVVILMIPFVGLVLDVMLNDFWIKIVTLLITPELGSLKDY